jgi:effector-binding domain-containing protein
MFPDVATDAEEDWSMSEVKLVELDPQPVAVVRGHVTVEGIPGFLGAAYDEVIHMLTAEGQEPAGPPFGRYEKTDSGFSIVAGFPTLAPVAPLGRVQADTLPGGLTASLLYRGDYAGIAAAYDAAQQWLADHGFREAGQPWESYLDGPEVAQPRTILQIPCAARSADAGAGHDS